MNITNDVSLKLEDLVKVNEYIALYEEANKLRVDKYSSIPVFYKNKLENIREIETIRLFEIEKAKLDEILKMSKSLEDYLKFKKELYSAIESDVMVIYDDI